MSTVPAGNLAKASLVGANTVNGPALSRVSTSPAAFTAATSVVWSCELTAFSTMFLVGYIAAPPTSGSFWARTVAADRERVTATRTARTVLLDGNMGCTTSDGEWTTFPERASPVFGFVPSNGEWTVST